MATIVTGSSAGRGGTSDIRIIAGGGRTSPCHPECEHAQHSGQDSKLSHDRIPPDHTGAAAIPNSDLPEFIRWNSTGSKTFRIYNQ